MGTYQRHPLDKKKRRNEDDYFKYVMLPSVLAATHRIAARYRSTSEEED